MHDFAAPVNWLTSLRASMSNKRKHQQHQQQQRTKNQAGGGAAAGGWCEGSQPSPAIVYGFSQKWLSLAFIVMEVSPLLGALLPPCIMGLMPVCLRMLNAQALQARP